MSVRRSISRTRRKLYRTASVLGDVEAALGGPDKVVKRVIRKSVWRTLARFASLLTKGAR